MTTAEKIVNGATTFLQSVATFGKCLLMSRRAFPAPPGLRERPVIVMGNGPSLNDMLSRNPRAIRKSDLMAVNFAPNAALFYDLKPSMLVLADPHFFYGMDKDPNVARLWKRIGAVSWPMSLYVPVGHQARVRTLLTGPDGKPNADITIKPFNLTPAEGYRGLRLALYRQGTAMPRPRNVLIPAIMIALREGYRDIRLTGADHSWSRTLWVDDMNRVISIQPHFYPDTEKERERVAKEYEGYHLHHIFNSLAVAFRSYFDIADYAETIGAKITNCTPGSFIDAFPRGDIDSPQQ